MPLKKTLKISAPICKEWQISMRTSLTQLVATAIWASLHNASPLATASFAPTKREPSATIFSINGWLESFTANVALWRIGNEGENLSKNTCMHVSKNEEVMPVFWISAVKFEDSTEMSLLICCIAWWPWALDVWLLSLSRGRTGPWTPSKSDGSNWVIGRASGQVVLMSEVKNSSMPSVSPHRGRDVFPIDWNCCSLLTKASPGITGLPCGSAERKLLISTCGENWCSWTAEVKLALSVRGAAGFSWSFWCLDKTSCRPNSFEHCGQEYGLLFESEVRWLGCQHVPCHIELDVLAYDSFRVSGGWSINISHYVQGQFDNLPSGAQPLWKPAGKCGIWSCWRRARSCAWYRASDWRYSCWESNQSQSQSQSQSRCMGVIAVYDRRGERCCRPARKCGAAHELCH